MINQKSNATKSSNLTKAKKFQWHHGLFEVVLGRRRDSKANWMRSAWFSGSSGTAILWGPAWEISWAADICWQKGHEGNQNGHNMSQHVTTCHNMSQHVTTCHNSKPLRCTRFVASWGASAWRADMPSWCVDIAQSLPLECLTPDCWQTCQSQKRLILYTHMAYDSIYVNIDQYSIGPDSLLVLVPTCVNGQTPISPMIISWLSAKRKDS